MSLSTPRSPGTSRKAGISFTEWEMGNFGAGSLLATFHSGFACLLSSQFTNFSVSWYIMSGDSRDQIVTSVVQEHSFPGILC